MTVCDICLRWSCFSFLVFIAAVADNGSANNYCAANYSADNYCAD